MNNVFTTDTTFVAIKNIGDLCQVFKKTVNLNPQVPKKNLRDIKFLDNRKKIPADLWSAIVDLYFHFAKEFDSEVRVEFYKEKNTNEWKVGVPKQQVTTGSVTHQDQTNQIDILTGETFNPEKDLELQNWINFGSSHSHGKLTLSNFSGTDDKEELNKEGVHILVSNINLKKRTYVITGSIVWDKERNYVEASELIDLDTESDTSFHPNCIKQVSRFINRLPQKIKFKNNYTSHHTFFYSDEFYDDFYFDEFNTLVYSGDSDEPSEDFFFSSFKPNVNQKTDKNIQLEKYIQDTISDLIIFCEDLNIDTNLLDENKIVNLFKENLKERLNGKINKDYRDPFYFL